MRFLFLLLLFAASSGYADSERFRNAVQAALDAEPALCLGETHWPVTIANGRDGWLTARMAALADAGLITPSRLTDKTVWRLTTSGNRQYQRHQDFCYGRMRVDSIQHVQIKQDNIVEVTFTYNISGLPAWASNKAVRVANNDLDNLLMGIDKVRWRASFDAASLSVINEPEQLDLLY